ncbi:MAG: UvrB/UvrC motif-containing protein [bacterium]
MRCRKCLRDEAAFFITGRGHTQVGLCVRCAEGAGILAVLRKVEALLHGFSGEDAGGAAVGGMEFPLPVAEACGNCGTTLREFERGFQFGCAECSDLFASLVCNYISLFSGDDAALSLYGGKAPHEYGVKKHIQTLQSELRKSIEREDYLRAARERDRIQKLETGLMEKRRRGLAVLSVKRGRVESARGADVRRILSEVEREPAGTALRPWMETRVELRRNFSEFLFPPKMDDAHRTFVREYFLKTVPRKYIEGKAVVHVEELAPLERRWLGQRYAGRKLREGACVVAGPGDGTWFIVNDEEHVSMVSRSGAGGGRAAVETLGRLHRAVQQKAEFAFSRRFGYISTSPRNLGGGADVQAVFHLPFSLCAGRAHLYQSEAERRRLYFDTLSGACLERHGFFRLSPYHRLGRTMEETAEEVFSMAEWLTGMEEAAREKEMKKSGAAGRLARRVLKNAAGAHRLSYQDVLRMATFIEVGMSVGVVEWEDYSRRRMFLTMTSPYIQYADGRRYTVNACERRRAEIFSGLIRTSVRW